MRHTEMAIAQRDGDHEKLARLEAEQERVMSGFEGRIVAALDDRAHTPYQNCVES